MIPRTNHRPFLALALIGSVLVCACKKSDSSSNTQNTQTSLSVSGFYMLNSVGGVSVAYIHDNQCSQALTLSFESDHTLTTTDAQGCAVYPIGSGTWNVDSNDAITIAINGSTWLKGSASINQQAQLVINNTTDGKTYTFIKE